METIARLFDQSMMRFALSGTLILCFAIANHVASRRRAPRSRAASPRWVTPLMWLSIGAYYLLIAPTGGALLGGAGNGAGIVLCLASFVMRAAPDVRYPELGSRSLFYVALPIAVGVPWGLVVLSLPAVAASLWCSMRADRLLATPAGNHGRFRMMRGIW